MQITASAISLNVEAPAESAAFVKRHLGFIEDMAYDGFVSLSKQDAGFNLIYLRTGLESFKPDSMRGRHADGPPDAGPDAPEVRRPHGSGRAPGDGPGSLGGAAGGPHHDSDRPLQGHQQHLDQPSSEALAKLRR